MSHWAQIMRERSESGQNKREFCRASQIRECVYYYWQRKLREATCSELSVQKVEQAKSAVEPNGWVSCAPQEREGAGRIVIEAGKYRVVVEAGFDTETMGRVCQMLGSLC